MAAKRFFPGGPVWLVLLLLVAGMVIAGEARAQSVKRNRGFLEALRQRGYFEYAQLYLDELEKKPGVAADLKRVIDFERAMTYMEAGRAAGSPLEKSALFDRAVRFLDKFVKANPTHELASDANSQRGRILLGKARVEIWHSQSPSNAARKVSYQEKGRQLVVQARDIFQAAHDQYEKALKAFPRNLDRIRQKELYAQRKQAESDFMRAQYDLALCTYEEAQTWDRGGESYGKLLTTASVQFEAIHTRYRSQVLGLYARIWQGKSFEEQGDINKAMGIYKELLDHPGGSQTMRTIQDMVLRFKLICLNHEKKQDYLLVITEAQTWLGQRRARERRTPDALGVLWEQVRAQELLADRRTTPENIRDQLLTAALTSCRFIQRWPSKYKEVALFKMRELQVRLKGAAVDPQDFDAAFGIGHDLFNKIKDRNEALAAARKENKPAAEIAKLQQERVEHLAATREMLLKALGMVSRDTSKDDLNRARFCLAFVYYQQRENYEAAVLGDFLSRRVGRENATMAVDSAAIAMASHVRAYNDSKTPQLKQQDLALIESTAKWILKSWPGSDRAQETRLQLAQVYEGKRPLEAARQYALVSDQTEAYGEAQTRAGQQFWRAWLERTPTTPGNTPPTQQELDSRLASARKHLETGIGETRKNTPDNVAAPELLIAAKVSLVQILNSNGEYQPAVALLTGEPHSVMKAIQVADEAQRPEKGVQAREFASLAAQLLLRARIGQEDLDKAQAAMTQLETIAGAAKGESVTELYRQLGDELKQELGRLKSAGNQQRLAKVQESFEGFLERLRQRPEQTINSLLWVAETYSGLGQGATETGGKSGEYFGHAASSYQAILDRAKADTTFLSDEGMKAGVQLRLANCRIHQGQFAAARTIVVALLKNSPMALDIQFEAARLYQAWGKSGQAENFDKAIAGVKSEGVLGWSQIALLLQRLIDRGSKESPRYRDRRWEARYNQLQCRLAYAEAVSAKSADQLSRARSEIQGMMMVTLEVAPKWAGRYDEAYREILTRLGEPVITLSAYRLKYKPEPVVPSSTPRPTTASATSDKLAEEETGSGSGLWGMVFGGAVLVGGGLGFVVLLSGDKRRRKARRRYVPEAAPAPVARERSDPAAAGRRRRRGKTDSARPKGTDQPKRPPKPRPEA